MTVSPLAGLLARRRRRHDEPTGHEGADLAPGDRWGEPTVGDLTAVVTLATALATCSTIGEAGDVTTRMLRDEFGWTHAALWLGDPNESLACVSETGPPAPDAGVVAEQARTERRPVWAAGDGAPLPGPMTCAAPLLVGGTPLGALTCHAADGSERDLRIVRLTTLFARILTLSVTSLQKAGAFAAEGRLLASAMETFGDGILLLDPAGEVVFTNTAMRGLTAQLDQPDAVSLAATRTRAGEEVEEELTGQLEGGAERTVALSSRRLVGSTPKSGATVVVLRDISERALLEEARKDVERLAAISRFSAETNRSLGDLVDVIATNADAAIESDDPALRLARIRSAATGARALSSEIAHVHRGSPIVLVVDDEPRARNALLLNLQHEGLLVLSAGEGDEALALGSRYRGLIHLLVADIIMPNMSGPRLAHALVDRHPEMKVMYVSGHTDDGVTHIGPSGEAVILLEKPFGANEFIDTVRKVLASPRVRMSLNTRPIRERRLH